jgi:hypothetical protein
LLALTTPRVGVKAGVEGGTSTDSTVTGAIGATVAAVLVCGGGLKTIKGKAAVFFFFFRFLEGLVVCDVDFLSELLAAGS